MPMFSYVAKDKAPKKVVLLESGVTLLRSLDIIVSQIQNRELYVVDL